MLEMENGPVRFSHVPYNSAGRQPCSRPAAPAFPRSRSRAPWRIGARQEQPVVDPQVSQRMQVPLRTRVKCPHTGHGSPS